MVTAILAVHGVLAAFFAQLLPLLFQENIELLQSWGVWKGVPGPFSGIVFVPIFGVLLAPGLAAMTALSFIAGAAASLAYLFLGLDELWVRPSSRSSGSYFLDWPANEVKKKCCRIPMKKEEWAYTSLSLF